MISSTILDAPSKVLLDDTSQTLLEETSKVTPNRMKPGLPHVGLGRSLMPPTPSQIFLEKNSYPDRHQAVLTHATRARKGVSIVENPYTSRGTVRGCNRSPGVDLAGYQPYISGELKGSDPPPKDMSIPEQSIQQLEQVLASMKLNMEQAKLKKSNVGTAISPSAGTVGPVLYLDIKMEEHPVKTVVDSGAQSTIISCDLLHQVAANMKKNGCIDPDLVLPSPKLFGQSGADSSELTITAETEA